MRRSTIIRTLAAAILAATLALSQLLPLSTALGDEVATDSGPPPSTSNLPGIVVDRPDAEVARARDTDDIRAVLLDAARVEGAGTTDDDAEKTPWWLLRPSDFEVTPSQLASLDVKIVRPPEDSGYVISDPIPATDIPSLQYTSRDWSRWDSFDIQEDLMFTPTPFASTTKDNTASRVLGITNGGSSFQLPINQTVPSSITSGAKLASAKTLSAETYHSLFKAYIETTLYPRGYSWFKSSTKNPTDWIKTFKSSGLIPLRDVLTNASYALNENYNVFRTAKRASLRSSITAQLKSAGQATDTATVEQKVDAAFDALKIDWLKDMPRNKKLVEWYEMLLDQIMAKQSLSHTQTSKGGFGQPYDSFGLFLGFEYDPTSYDINLYHFHAYEWGLVASRYVKLLSTGMIRKVRKSIYASLAPQYFVWQKRIGVEDARTNQWIMRVIGWTTHAYFALKSEAILRARGVWDDATDGYYNKVTDWPNGRATNSDLLKHAESVALRLAKRTRMVGMTEYLATYYGLSLKCISETIMLSPSQVAYDALETVYKTYWYDLAGNFFSSSSFISGPTGRHYDLFLGSVTFWENWLRPLYAQHFFQPACAVRQTTKNPATGASVVEAYNGCIVGAPVMQPGPTWVNEQFEMEFMHHAVMQAAGYGYLPYDVFVQNNLGKPYRSLWGRFSLVKGQERYNFITPTYQIGTGGEDATGVPFNNVVNARLTGSAVKGAPVSVVSNSWNSLAPSMVRMFVESNDQPFTRPSTYAVAGKDVQEQARYVNVQYQSFMLTTSFVSGRPGLTGSDSRRPWNTNLVLPLAVDALYADTTRLPTTAGSVVAIPPGAIITVRHGSASIVLRVLRLDADAPIKTASKVTTLSSSGGAYDPGVGKQEHSMTWVVDKEGITSGVGRIVIHHTHRKDSSYSATPMGQWRVATLWAAGRTPDANSMEALQRLVRQAKFTESITNSADWKPSDQPWSGKPKASWDGKSPMGTSTWRATVSISGVPTLKVERQDVYQPNSRDAVWSQPSASPFNVSPYYLKSFSRTIDDKEMFDGLKYSQTLTFDDSAAQAMIGDTPAFFTVGHKEDEILEPHLAKPSVCRPGIDFPCYQWMTSGDTGSGTCTQAATDGRCGWRSYIKSGATVKCVDASSQNKQVDDSLCDSTKPSTVTCNSNAAGLADASSASSPSIQIGTFTLPLAGTLPASGACLPSRPTNVQATVVGATARVTWSPPNQPKEGAQESQNYYVLAVPQASPGKLIAVMSRTSPTSVPLPLGVLYKFRVAGENSAGVGEWSDRSNALSASSSSSKFLAPSAHALLDENGSVTINFQTDESAAGYLALLQPISGTASSKVDDSVDLYSFSTDSSLVIPEAIRATTFKYAVAKVSDTGNVSAYSTPLVASQPGAASKLPVSAIAGIVIGGLVGTGVLAVLLAMLYRRHREEKVSVKGTMVPQQEVAAGATGTKAVTEELHHVHIASVASPKYGKVGTNEMRQPLSPRNMQPSESAVEPFASPAGPVSSSQHQKNYPVYMPVGPLPSPSPSPSPSPTPSPPPPIRFRGE